MNYIYTQNIIILFKTLSCYKVYLETLMVCSCKHIDTIKKLKKKKYNILNYPILTFNMIDCLNAFHS